MEKQFTDLHILKVVILELLDMKINILTFKVLVHFISPVSKGWFVISQ